MHVTVHVDPGRTADLSNTASVAPTWATSTRRTTPTPRRRSSTSRRPVHHEDRLGRPGPGRPEPDVHARRRERRAVRRDQRRGLRRRAGRDLVRVGRRRRPRGRRHRHVEPRRAGQRRVRHPARDRPRGRGRAPPTSRTPRASAPTRRTATPPTTRHRDHGRRRGGGPRDHRRRLGRPGRRRPRSDLHPGRHERRALGRHQRRASPSRCRPAPRSCRPTAAASRPQVPSRGTSARWPTARSATLHVTVHVDPDRTAALSNTATVSSDVRTRRRRTTRDRADRRRGPAPTCRSRSPTLPIRSSPVSDLTYTLVVANDGPSDATNVVVSDPVPAGTTFVSADGGGLEAAGTVTWNLGTLADGASATLHVTVHVNGGRTSDLSNTASVGSRRARSGRLQRRRHRADGRRRRRRPIDRRRPTGVAGVVADSDDVHAHPHERRAVGRHERRGVRPVPAGTAIVSGRRRRPRGRRAPCTDLVAARRRATRSLARDGRRDPRYALADLSNTAQVDSARDRSRRLRTTRRPRATP